MAEGTCSLPDCGGKSAAFGWCDKHYRRWKRYGSPETIMRHVSRDNPATCTIGGCDKAYVARGYCKTHYHRFRQNGAMEPQQCQIGETVEQPRQPTPSSYAWTYLPGHPLANARGGVRKHRVVLYGALGPGAHPCHWCGTSVRWEGRWPADADALVVDHFDQDIHNNDLANLVQSCGPCNSGRTPGSQVSP